MKKYEAPSIELIKLNMADVITASGDNSTENENTTPIAPFPTNIFN